jgi:two-component system sensor histidine kinase DesK
MNVREGLWRTIRGDAADCPAGPVDAAGYSRSGPGSRSWMRWFFSAIWLVYLIQPVSALFGGHHGALWIAGGLAIVTVFCVVYVGLCMTWDRNQYGAQWGLAVLFAMAVLACVIYGKDWTPLWIYVSVATGFAVPGRRPAMLAVLVVGACYALFSWLAHVGTAEFLIILVPVVLAGWAMTGFRMQIALISELAQARDTVARLAANQERLRLARDLHDLAGHSLSLITLKAELAQRMLDRLPASAERDRAAHDVADIERVSRQTLHDIREAVSGYRRPTLPVELATARTALEAAGIRLDGEPALPQPGPAGPEQEAALAWCLREAVTNVIRHSGAGSCRIRLLERRGELSLEVTDDGRGIGGPGSNGVPAGSAPVGSGPVGSARGGSARGGSGPVGSGPAGTAPVGPGPGGSWPGGSGPGGSGPGGRPEPGSGLRGMSERLSAVGGSLSAGPARAGGSSGRGFRLGATVPVAAQPAGPGVQPPDAAGQAIVNAAP